MDSKNLFFSYYKADVDYYHDIVESLHDRGYFSFRTSSIDEDTQIPSKDPKVIKEGLAKKIDFASTLIVLIGPHTHERYWVNWEIKYALEHGKRVIGCFLPLAYESPIPSALDEFGDALVRWNTDNLVEAIRGKNFWESGKYNTSVSRRKKLTRVC